MFNDFQLAPDKTRVIELENGNKLRMTINDPYGFITLSLEHGQLPGHLKDQSFTEWRLAELAANQYVKDRASAVSELKAPVKKVG